MIVWFWHELDHHVTTPLARRKLWSAYGGLRDLRLACVNLIRLRENFRAPLPGYRHIEQAVGAEQLAPLAATCCDLERGAMLQAFQELGRVIRTHFLLHYLDDADVRSTIQAATNKSLL
jgi:hypothetical protein